MKFYNNLYISESLEQKKAKIIRKLEKGKVQLSCYLIVLTENPRNQLEFFDAVLLKQANYQKENLFVAGIANCYEEALELVQKMAQDTYAKNGNADIRKFLSEEQEKFEESRE